MGVLQNMRRFTMTVLLFNLYTNYFLKKYINKRHHTTNYTFEKQGMAFTCEGNSGQGRRYLVL